ncbi:acetyltransferase [Vibrio ezurae]|uniref:PglD N-terminal domain-containing protein n=1 Tax=Vibrio ezurae NBRC 102218 TaxID=1219080 RepID=U3B0Y3_9VIBR|nr:acetyltransferase [Vibrio ezurae]GAD79630.1 hypothetical protein VEZ01S_19_00450 [Vibrio ezurae NBRC 102218]
MKKFILYGAKGLAKELLNHIDHDYQCYNVVFFDNISKVHDEFISDNFRILKTNNELEEFRKSEVIIAVGGPRNRGKIYNFLELNDFTPFGFISNRAHIGKLDNKISKSAVILSGSEITISVSIGNGTLINKGVTISHDVKIGKFVEISPGAKIMGRCEIGDFSQVGAGAVILPDIKVGKDCIVGAGSIVTKDIPDNHIHVGVPAKFLKVNDA